jgi:type IVB pilus formation R64 PilN family outer membrane protein
MQSLTSMEAGWLTMTSLCTALRFALLLLILTPLSGCATTDRTSAKERQAEILSQADQRLEEIRDAPPSISALTEEESPWLGSTAIAAQSGELLPASFETNEALVLTFEAPLSLSEVATRIQAATGLRVTVAGATSQDGQAMNSNLTFLPADGLEVTGGRTVWQGKLSSLLDQIGDRFDAEWTYSHNSIRISQQVVRTFMLHALAGSTEVGGSVKTSGAGAEGGLPQQTVDSTSKLALWEEIQKAIETILSGKARASYSPASGTITVAGSPSAVRSVEEYLTLQNKLRLRRVAIEAQVLSVRLNKAYDHNLDVTVVIEEAIKNQPFIFTSVQGASGRDVTTGILRTDPAASLGTLGTTGAVINALSAVSEKVSVEYSGTLVTLSDQPAPLQVATKRAYVARVSGSASDTTSATSLEPGTIDLGLSMNLLPRVIEDDRIMLRIAMGITDLVQLREFSSGDSTIQLPEVDSTGFLQNAVLQSGETLVLAGFEKKNANYNRNGVGHPNNFLLGGGENFAEGREIRVLLIKANLLPPEPISVIRP